MRCIFSGRRRLLRFVCLLTICISVSFAFATPRVAVAYDSAVEKKDNEVELREELENQLALEEDRIQALEKTYRALTVAQETLDQARAELQRRYAPKITRRAGDFLARMTDGRYHSLTMGQDFSLRAAAGEEGLLRDIQWRSDGTVDQLYLALRLAVAEVLTPGAPLILDDALARFDDRRLKAAMELLKDLAKDRQIVCFTCQSREKGAG